MNRMIKLLGLAALCCTAGTVLADEQKGSHADALALDIIRHLEVNTFPNSLRPRHLAPGTTLGQTPYHLVEKAPENARYRATDEEKSWIYSVRVLKTAAEGVSICFGDRSLEGTYNATAHLLVKQQPNHHYVVIKELPDSAECSTTRG